MHPVLTLDKDNPRQKGKTTGSLLVKEGHINLFGTKRVALVASGDRDSWNGLKEVADGCFQGVTFLLGGPCFTALAEEPFYMHLVDGAH